MRILKYGSIGPSVQLLQLGLNRAGYGPLETDGIFGTATMQAVTRFQQANGLQTDGIVGSRTHRALLPWCSRVLLTQTCADLPADRFFPDLDRLPNWRCTDTGPLQEDGGHCFRYLTYENDAPLPL